MITRFYTDVTIIILYMVISTKYNVEVTAFLPWRDISFFADRKNAEYNINIVVKIKFSLKHIISIVLPIIFFFCTNTNL